MFFKVVRADFTIGYYMFWQTHIHKLIIIKGHSGLIPLCASSAYSTESLCRAVLKLEAFRYLCFRFSLVFEGDA